MKFRLLAPRLSLPAWEITRDPFDVRNRWSGLARSRAFLYDLLDGHTYPGREWAHVNPKFVLPQARWHQWAQRVLRVPQTP
jgi:hypothetical protein